MARRPHSFTEEDFESLEGRASKTEQKKAVQRMASLGSQLAELNTKQIQNLRLPKESKGQIVSLFSTLTAELGGDLDKAEAVQFKDRYERHKADYIEDGSKFGG